TGFGLLGHLANICKASDVSAEIHCKMLPVIDSEVIALIARGCVPGGTLTNLDAARDTTDLAACTRPWRQLLGDPQTSGGLLLCVAQDKLAATLSVLEAAMAQTVA